MGDTPELIVKLPVFPVPAGLPVESAWRLRVEGLVQSPLILDLASVRSLPAVTLAADFSCEEGWTVPGLRWRGIPLRVILELAGVEAEAGYVAAGSGDFVAVLPLSMIGACEPLLAYELNGKPLPQAHGWPLRLVASSTACYQSVKWVDHLVLTGAPAEETARSVALARLASRR